MLAAAGCNGETINGTVADGTGNAGPGDPCSGVSCGASARCEPATRACVCAPGFTDAGGGRCEAIPSGDPAGRTADEVCERWRAGHVENEQKPWNEVPGDACAPGSLTSAAIE